ncbi:MAG TPA: universal stress protein [Chromatiales bacterium]|nr:universal stress protein [Chromatiales bacterium]
MMPEQPPLLLVCVDLEAGSANLVKYAARQARSCGSSLRVLYVSPSRSAGRDVREQALARLHQLIDGPFSGLDIDAVDVEAGIAEEVIVEYARRHHVGQILLGRRHRSTVERIYVGSTTSAVISLARRPVLVVPVDVTGDRNTSDSGT